MRMQVMERLAFVAQSFPEGDSPSSQLREVSRATSATLPRSAQPRVGSVAEGFADEIVGRDRHKDREAGEVD